MTATVEQIWAELLETQRRVIDLEAKLASTAAPEDEQAIVTHGKKALVDATHSAAAQFQQKSFSFHRPMKGNKR